MVNFFVKINMVWSCHIAFSRVVLVILLLFYYNLEKAKDELSKDVQYSIDEMVRNSWNKQKNNPEGYR